MPRLENGLNHSHNRVVGENKTSFQKISFTITTSLENFFYRWGYTVASNPFRFIVICISLTLLCGVGLFNFSMESRPDKLWIAQESVFAHQTQWLRSNFPSPIRSNWAIVTADNVLVPKVFELLLKLHEEVNGMVVDGKRYKDICFTLPVTKFGSERRRRRSIGDARNTSSDNSVFKNDFQNFNDEFDDDFFREDVAEQLPHNTVDFYDASLLFPERLYCSIINELDRECWEVNPMEMWSYNKDTVRNLTSEDIVRSINHLKISPIFGRRTNYTEELGGRIVRDKSGQIISAESVIIKWAVAINQSDVNSGKAVSDIGTGEIVDKISLQFEALWQNLMEKISKELPDGVRIYYATGRSWGDISEATIFDDGLMLVAGFTIMFIYVGLMLGKFNMVEQRPYLSVAGISCVGLSVIVSFGVCSCLGLMYGPVNKILPFLLLGIGIDDMFVIMQCWNNLYPDCATVKYKQTIPERMANTLKRAGVSITVTSLTDVAAFAVGASTILPGLRSFCIYAAVGIVAVFFLQATFFVAWFTVDQQRLESRKNAFLFFCDRYNYDDNFVPSSWSQVSLAQTFFDKYFSKYLFTPLAKVLVLLLTATFLAINIYGNIQLRQEFDPVWFLPKHSYLAEFIEKREDTYPGTGYPAFLVADQVNWTASFKNFQIFSDQFKSSNAIFEFHSWYDDFKQYSNQNFKTDIPNDDISPAMFQKYLGKFLFSSSGSKYSAYFKTEGNLTCGDKLAPVKLAMMQFRFRTFSGPEEHIPGMHEVKDLVRNANLTFNDNSDGTFFAWTTGFVSWETDEIITGELYRNVAISFLCVVVTTFFLFADARMCFLCGLCVIFTLVNVGGLMYFWGLTIDMVSCIDIVLGIGLCVDYAAHIGLAFMTCTGTRDSRAKQSLRDIGPAVLNGGFSTFLAIILLANSESHAFKSFFKIFTVVVCFGLFHGLVFLPVILSVLGPDPYLSAYGSRKDLTLLPENENTVELRPLANENEINDNCLTKISCSDAGVLP